MQNLSFTRFALFCLFATTSVVSASDQWTEVSANDKAGTFSVKDGSFMLEKNKGDEDIATVIGKGVDSKTSQVSVEKWYVTTADCGRGAGKLVTLDINGDFLYENSFANGSGSIASDIAELICAVYEMVQANAREKSI